MIVIIHVNYYVLSKWIYLIMNFILQISYVDYYKKMYDLEIKNLNQPMLITKSKKKDISNKNQPKVCNKI